MEILPATAIKDGNDKVAGTMLSSLIGHAGKIYKLQGLIAYCT